MHKTDGQAGQQRFDWPEDEPVSPHDPRDHAALFAALARSEFRSRFRLGAKEQAYLEEKGIDAILQHARQFVRERLAAASPVNDGKQTPMRNHPVFVAQHATGTCCRGCLAKWHRIPAGRALDDGQIEYIVAVIEEWLRRQERAAQPSLGHSTTESHGGR
jgi:hypothetical protein